MKITIGLFFVFTVTVSCVASEAVVTKDIYSGKREEDHGGKPIMAQLQFTNNVGHNSHYVLAPAGQQPAHKHPLGLTFAASPHTNSHLEPVPYPGVYSYQSRLGPIQYALSQHQPMSHQPPVHMILTYHPNSPPPHRNIINQIHHAPPPPPSSLNHITIGGPQFQKFSQPPHNSIHHVGHHFLQFPQQPQPQPQQHQQQHHAFRPHSHQSAFVPIAVPLQYVQHKPTSGQAFTIIPGPHQGVSPTAAATASAVTATATAATAHQQQDEPHQHTVGPTAHSTATTILQPVQHHASAQPETHQQYIVQPTPSQVYHQHQHQQQQPHYSYSIQPSIQVAATKQVLVPIPSSSPHQYKQDNNLGSNQYSNEPAVPVQQQQHHVYYPTHSTPVYSTSKPYIMAPIHPTGPGSTVDYTSGAGVVYQQLGGKASAVSASKYA